MHPRRTAHETRATFDSHEMKCLQRSQPESIEGMACGRERVVMMRPASSRHLRPERRRPVPVVLRPLSRPLLLQVPGTRRESGREDSQVR